MGTRKKNTNRAPKASEADEPESVVARRHRPDENPPNQRGPAGSGAGERHAIGNITGGTPVGGLAGSNTGDGTPEADEVDEAAGDANFNRDFDADQEDAYSGRGGGAVGGSPANKRARGGRE